MATKVTEYSDLGAREPEVLFPRRKQLITSGNDWLKFKRDYDGIGANLWRVHDKLYNLTDFAKKHPGGAQWINLTNGTDITEAFEAAHVFGGHKKILEKYFVKDCHMPRKSPLTFHEDGFYKTLQRNVRSVLKQIGTGPSREMILIQDGLVAAFLLMMAVTIKTDSFLAAVVTGTILGMTIASSHNFFHQKDNFRRYYWDLGLFTSTDWRITHALSHHFHTNMYTDFEIWSFDPHVQWLPLKEKSFYHTYLSPIISLILFFVVSIISILKKVRILFQGHFDFSMEDVLPIAELAIMCYFSGQTFWKCLQLWSLIHCMAGLWFIGTSLTVTHHHPGVRLVTKLWLSTRPIFLSSRFTMLETFP